MLAMTSIYASCMNLRTIAKSCINQSKVVRRDSLSVLAKSYDDKKAVKVTTTVVAKESHNDLGPIKSDPDLSSSCSRSNTPDTELGINEEEEKVDMFATPHRCLGHNKIEWNGPTRGGKYAEPTRFGDWERKGRCSDF